MPLRVRQREKEEMLYTQLKELQERVSFADAARALTELYGVYIWSFYIHSVPSTRYTTDRNTSVCGGALLLSLLFSLSVFCVVPLFRVCIYDGYISRTWIVNTSRRCLPVFTVNWIDHLNRRRKMLEQFPFDNSKESTICQNKMFCWVFIRRQRFNLF